MRRLSLLAFFHIIFFNGICQIGIGTSSPNTSAALDITSNTKGFLPPRMTAAQRTAISSPAEGLVVFQTDGTKGLYYYISGSWNYLSSTINTTSTTSHQTKLGYSSSGTWTCPEGIYQITVELWGGAGGGGGSGGIGFENYGTPKGLGNCDNPITFPALFYNVIGGKGGAGGYNKATLTVIPGTTYSITIGAGGAGGVGGTGGLPLPTSSKGQDGIDGSPSIFSTVLTALGGSKGIGSTSVSGFTQSYGNTTIAGTDGANGNSDNYSYDISSITTRSYIPQNLLTQTNYPLIGLGGGLGGTKKSGYNSHPTTGASINFFTVGNDGSKGEDGFCIISY